jgi:enamine deaminase RidA (YjgF/YER057c/UK114 family)
VPTIQCLNPDSMAKPLAAYSNISRVKASEYLFIAGQIGTEKNGKAPADFEAQCALVFEAIGAALASQGAGFANIVSFTSYLVHSQDIPKFAAYRARDPPPVSGRRLSAQYAARRRSPGARGFAGRSRRRRGFVEVARPAFDCEERQRRSNPDSRARNLDGTRLFIVARACCNGRPKTPATLRRMLPRA